MHTQFVDRWFNGHVTALLKFAIQLLRLISSVLNVQICSLEYGAVELSFQGTCAGGNLKKMKYWKYWRHLLNSCYNFTSIFQRCKQKIYSQRRNMLIIWFLTRLNFLAIYKCTFVLYKLSSFSCNVCKLYVAWAVETKWLFMLYLFAQYYSELLGLFVLKFRL